MRSILVAIDQFPAAETTVSVAAGLASVLETPLCILHVRPAAVAPFAPTATPRPPDPDRRQEVLAELHEWSALLSDLETAGGRARVEIDLPASLRHAAGLAQRAGVATVLTCLTAGDPVEIILAQTQRTNADLLVIGRGRTPQALGQTAAAVISRCPCAVMIAGGAIAMH